MGPPPAGFEQEPPTPEPLEQRGPMEGHPRYASRPPGPLAKRLLDALRGKGDQLIQVFSGRLGGARWTARALEERARQLARGLTAEGVRPGDAVAYVTAAHPDGAPLMIACFLIGAVFGPVNHRFDWMDMKAILMRLRPKLVLHVKEASPALERAKSALIEERRWPGTRFASLDGEEWDAIGRRGGQSDDSVLPPPPEDPCSVVAMVPWSSGTTGLPKGVVYTHATMHAVIDIFLHPDFEMGTDGKVLFTSPTFWVTGVWYNLFSIAKDDCCIVNEYGATEEQFLEAIEQHKPQAVFTANNFLLSATKMHEATAMDDRCDLSSLRIALCSGAAMSHEADAFVQATLPHCSLLSLYGMTEINCGIGITKGSVRKIGSVGKLCPFLRCKVVDVETGKALGPNQQGELRFKGPTLTQRYLENPEATNELCDEGGWMHSGDLGHYDEGGMFFITGRIKDIIKYRGVHVSPIELEGLLEGHPAVLESAVVGVPHPTEQELPRAYVVLRDGASASAEELQALIQEKVAEHKWLRGGVVFLTALPKSATGKISRADIRRRFVEQKETH